jgi:hypothetical protein
MKRIISNSDIEEVLKTIDQNYITHYSNEKWGTIIHVIKKDGLSYGDCYWYNGEEHELILCNLNVNNKSRRNGLGREIQEIREEIGCKLGFSRYLLWVRNNSWMYDWYIRRGYKYYQKKGSYTTWMIKNIKPLP